MATGTTQTSAVRVNTYYPTTAFGVVGKIIFDAENLNEKAIRVLVQSLAAMFRDKVGVAPSGQEAFCLAVVDSNSYTEIVSSEFFRSMEIQELSTHHEKVFTIIAPRMLKSAKEYFSRSDIAPADEEALKHWYTKFTERYLTAEEITAYYEPSGDEQLMAQRKAVGGELMKMVADKSFDKSDLNAMIQMCDAAFKSLSVTPTHPEKALLMAGKYLTLFAMASDPQQLKVDVVQKLTALKFP